jgi:hypothetical protein
MTQGQKDNAKRFKAVQVEAKKLKAKNPKLKHIDAVKKAWAMFSTSVKKTAKKKTAKKKVGAIKIVQKDKNEKVTKVLKQVRNKKTGQFKGYKQIAGVKTKKVSGRTGTEHKDSKSHNVNIRVVSGVNFSSEEIKFLQKEGKESKGYKYRAKILWGSPIVLKETENGTPIKKWEVDNLNIAQELSKELNKNKNFRKIKKGKI